MDRYEADFAIPIDASSGAATLTPAGALPRPVRAVVFDLDGTLLDTERLYRAAFMATLATFGLHLPAGDYDRLVGLPTTARRALLPAMLGEAVTADAFIAAYYRERSAGLAGGIQLKPGVRPLLATLAARSIPAAVATSASAATAGRHLALAGLDGWFATVVTRDDVARGKPAPDSFIAAAARLGTPPGDCLAVEDSPHGVAAAHAAGLMVVMVPDLIAPAPGDRARCDAVLPSLGGLLALLPAGAREPAGENDRSRLRV